MFAPYRAGSPHGALSGEGAPFPPMPVMKGKSMRSYTLHGITTDSEGLRRAEAFVVSGLRTGAFEPAVDRVCPFEGIADAHLYLEGGSQIDKIVMTVGR